MITALGYHHEVVLQFLGKDHFSGLGTLCEDALGYPFSGLTFTLEYFGLLNKAMS